MTNKETQSTMNLYINNEEEQSFNGLSPYIQSGILAHSVPSKVEERELAARIADGDESAVAELCLRNQRMLLEAVNAKQGCGVSADDLFEAGFEGLIDAARRFDAGRARFYRYAQEWVEKRLIECIHHEGSLIRVPKDAFKEMKDRYAEGLMESMDGAVSTEGFRPFRVDSLDEAIGDSDDDYTRAEMIRGEGDEYNTAILAEKSEARSQVFSLLEHSGLSDRDQTVIKLKFGIDCEHEMESADIAELEHLTVQRVNQIVQRGIEKMRAVVAA